MVMRFQGRTINPFWIFFLTIVIAIVAGQELPTLTLPAFDESSNVTYVTNFCEIHRQVENGEIDRRDALRGIDLSIALTDFYVTEDGINKDNKVAVTVQVLDYLASSAGFSWRNSYGVVPSTFPPDKTWTDLLMWSSKRYDIMADYWGHSNERMARGIIFPVGFYDFSLVMVRKSVPVDKFSLFSFLNPFTSGLWLVLILVIFSTGLIYYIIDLLDSRRLKRTRDAKSFLWSLYASAISFTDGHCSYNPKSLSTSLVSISTGLIFVIVISSYTANLTNFLITKQSGGLKIDEIQDALNANLDFCVWRGTPGHDLLIAEQASIIPKETQEDVFRGIETEECDIALVMKDDYLKFIRDIEYNSDCNLEWVGRTVLFEKGGFAMADSVTTCSSLVRDVFDIYIREMDQDNELVNIKDEFLERVGTIDCDKKEEEDAESMELNITNMGGILIIHAATLVVSLIISVISFMSQSPDTRKSMAESIRQSMITSMNPTLAQKMSDSSVDKTSMNGELSLSMADVHEMCKDMIQAHEDKIDQKFAALNDKLDRHFTNSIDDQSSVGGSVSMMSFFGKKVQP